MQQRLAAAAARPSVLTDIALVVAASLLTDAAAQVSLGWPVPITFQTCAVLGTSAYLGARLGVAAQLLYLAQGAAGLPVFADGDRGYQWLTGVNALHPSGGYLWGFPLAALVTGLICDRWGRSFYVTVPAMLLGSVALYVPGLLWLRSSLDLTWYQAQDLGLRPFVLGDLCKIAAAAAAIDPAAPWGRWVARRPSG
jgi:biotin transport system substrate-specific component